MTVLRMPKKKQQTITVTITPEQHARLTSLSKRTGISVDDLIRLALNPALQAILDVIKPDDVEKQLARLKNEVKEAKLESDRKSIERAIGHWEGLAKVLAKYRRLRM